MMRWRLTATAAPLALGLCWFAVAPTPAARVDYNPSVSLGVGYSSNLQFAETNEREDWSSNVGLRLPVAWTLQRGSINWITTGQYIKQDRISSLDRFNFGTNLGYNVQATRRLAVGVNGGFNRAQIQADDQFFGDEELFLTRRVETDAYQAGFNFTHAVSERWKWNGAVNWARRENDAIEDFVQDENELNDVEDRDSYTGNFGAGRQLSRKTNLGFGYRFSYFELQTAGLQRNHSLNVNLGHQTGPNSNINASVGAFSANGNASGENEDDVNAIGTFGYSQALRKTRFRASLSYAPNAGGNLRGTATQTTAVVGFSSRDTLVWTWNASARYGIRDSSDPLIPDRDSSGVRLALSRPLARNFGFSMGLNYVRQEIDLDGSNAVENFAGNVGFNWFPRGTRGR